MHHATFGTLKKKKKGISRWNFENKDWISQKLKILKIKNFSRELIYEKKKKNALKTVQLPAPETKRKNKLVTKKFFWWNFEKIFKNF